MMAGEVEVLEAATREAAVPLLKAKAPSLVVSHHHDFKRLLRDLDRHAPSATRAVLCPPGDEYRTSLADVATQGYEFETLDERAPRLGALLQSRSSTRRRPPTTLAARFSLGEHLLDATVREIGCDGLGFELPPSPTASRLMAGVLLERASVSASGIPVLEPRTWLVRFVRRSPDATSILVGVLFHTDQIDRQTASCVDDEVRIRGLFRRAAARHVWFELQRTDGALRRRFRSCVVAPEAERIVLRKPALDQPFHVGQVVRLSFELGGEQLEGLSIIVEADGESVTVARPEQLRRHHRRSCLRAHLADGIDAHITFHSALDGTRQRRPLLDLHPSGAAFAFSAEREAFPIGLMLHDVVVEVAGQRLRCAATVQSTSPAAPSETEGPAPTPQARRCGLLLREVTGGDAQVLRDVLVRALEPAVNPRGRVPFESIWALFREEGASYVDYPFEDPESLSTLARRQRELGDGANGLAKTFVYLQDDKPIGHASALRTHSRTWMSMHLLVRPGYHRAHRVSQSLVTLTFNYGESLPDVEYFKGLWRTKNRWASRFYGALTARLTRPGLSYLTSYTPTRRPMASELPAATLRARRAEWTDIELLLAQLRLTEDPARLASDDLVEGEALLDTIGRRFQAIGLDRGRSFGVVDGPRGPLGFVVIEHMSRGLFWVEMYNSFRLHLTDPSAPDADPIRHALIAFAVAELRAKGSAVAECHASDFDLPVLERLGFASLGRMMEFGAHRSLVREWEAQMTGFFDRLDWHARREGDET